VSMTGGPVAETASPLDEPVEIARGVTKLLAGCTRLELKAALRLNDAQAQRIRAVAVNIDDDDDWRRCQWAFSFRGSCLNPGSWIRSGRLATDRPRSLCSEHYREAARSREKCGRGRRQAFALITG
jgi:hypothetical protein